MQKIITRIAGLLAAMVLVSAVMAEAANAQYFRRPVSEVDPNIMVIDEKEHLGAKIDPGTVLVNQDGREFTWGEMLGQPVILVLSYYTCDGSCSLINSSLAALMKDLKLVTPGQDFKIVTLSFDRHDNLQSAGAFRKQQAIASSLAPHWTFATFKNEEDLKREIDKLGFKFFWSPEDRLFLHPGAFLFMAPDGRMARVLYQEEVEGRDVELAVLDAKQGQFKPREILTFALSLCYSYSYHDGRYVMSIPLIVGAGSLLVGLSLLFGFTFYYRSSRQTQRTGEKEYAQAV